MTRVGTAPTSYFGGKQQLAPRIVALFPPHEVYSEPFFGMGACFFAKSPASLEVISDADGLLVNFFRVLRDPVKGARLKEALELTPYAREEWADCQIAVKRAALMDWRDAADDVELARRWFTLIQMSFASRISGPARVSAGWRYAAVPKHNPATSFRSAIARLPQFTARLAETQIEHDDAQAIIQRYDTKHTLMYLDPPYLPDTRRGGGYAHEMSLDGHAQLLDLITAPTFKSMVILSGYDSALYRERLEQQCGWQRLEMTVASSAAGRTRTTNLQGEGAIYRAGQTRTEILWLNPAAQARQGLWAGLDATPTDDATDDAADDGADESTPTTPTKRRTTRQPRETKQPTKRETRQTTTTTPTTRRKREATRR